MRLLPEPAATCPIPVLKGAKRPFPQSIRDYSTNHDEPLVDIEAVPKAGAGTKRGGKPASTGMKLAQASEAGTAENLVLDADWLLLKHS